MIQKIIYALCLIIILINFYIGVNKYVWLDEISTLIEVNSLSPMQILDEFYQGIDTHPPFYFIIISGLKNIFGFDTVIAFRLVSFLFTIISLIFIYKIFRKFGHEKYFIVFLVIFSLTNYFIQYVSFEIRPYALYLLLFSAFILFYLEYTFEKKKGFSLLIVTTLLLYTHYFMLYYIVLILIIHLYLMIKENSYNNGFTILIISFILFLPWFPAIRNQFNFFNQTIHHEAPNLKTLIFLYFEYFRYMIIPLLMLLVVNIFNVFNSKNTLNHKNNYFSLFLSVIALTPVPIFILANYGYSVFSYRYMVPSALAIVILTSFSIKDISFFKKKWVQVGCVLFITLLAVHRINQNIIHVDKQKKMVSKHISFSTNTPLICETPQTFLQLYYYSNFNSSSKILFVNDSLVAIKSNPANHAIFDYYWWNKWRAVFNIDNIYTWEEFDRANYEEFYLIDEKRVKFFEIYIKDNKKYSTINVGDSLFYVYKN